MIFKMYKSNLIFVIMSKSYWSFFWRMGRETIKLLSPSRQKQNNPSGCKILFRTNKLIFQNILPRSPLLYILINEQALTAAPHLHHLKIKLTVVHSTLRPLRPNTRIWLFICEELHLDTLTASSLKPFINKETH